jgi:PAS domain-containing protein
MFSRSAPELPLLTAAITRRRVWHDGRGLRGPVLLYGLAVATVSGVALLTAAFPAVLGPAAGVLFLAAIVVSAWAGGPGPALAATALFALALELPALPWHQALEPGDHRVVGVAVLAVGIAISLLGPVGRLPGEALARSKEFVQSTLDALGAPIAIIGRDGDIVAENAAWRRSFRPGPPEGPGLSGRGYLDAWMAAGVDERAAIAQGVAEVLGEVRREFVGEFPQRRGEERRWFAVRVTRFEGEEGARAVVVHEDITERKGAEEAERRAEALRSVARLASAAAHEINNPLAIIMGNVEIIAQQIAPAVNDRIRPTLEAIERIRRIVQGMTDITNLELSQQSPSLPEMLDLHRSSASLEVRPRAR